MNPLRRRVGEYEAGRKTSGFATGDSFWMKFYLFDTDFKDFLLIP